MTASTRTVLPSCPIAGTLEVLGQKWSLLLLREAFKGSTRHSQFQRIGLPTATLTARLEALVAAGLLERSTYQPEGERARDEYLLTEAGRATLPILAALADWGVDHLDLAPSARPVLTADGHRVRARLVDDRGDAVSSEDVLARHEG